MPLIQLETGLLPWGIRTMNGSGFEPIYALDFWTNDFAVDEESVLSDFTLLSTVFGTQLSFHDINYTSPNFNSDGSVTMFSNQQYIFISGGADPGTFVRGWLIIDTANSVAVFAFLLDDPIPVPNDGQVLVVPFSTTYGRYIP